MPWKHRKAATVLGIHAARGVSEPRLRGTSQSLPRGSSENIARKGPCKGR